MAHATLGYQELLEIDNNYGGTPNWIAVAKGVKSRVPSPNEVVDQAQYMDGEGNGESMVTGGQTTISVGFDRFVGEPYQDYVLNLIEKYGSNRDTQARYSLADGNQKSGLCTIANIVPPSGDPAGKQEGSFEIHFNGPRTLTPAGTAPALTATVAAGSVSKSTKFTATAGEGNTLGYRLENGATTAPNANSFVSVIAYTSAANITATAGKYLNMYELDARGRVVKYLAQVLASGDIMA